jgi:exodeoxyribonuclease-3
LKILSYNVNGIRAALNKGFAEWLSATNPDVVCLQETKALEEQVNTDLFEQMGYHHFWHSAQKKRIQWGRHFNQNQSPKHSQRNRNRTYGF